MVHDGCREQAVSPDTENMSNVITTLTAGKGWCWRWVVFISYKISHSKALRNEEASKQAEVGRRGENSIYRTERKRTNCSHMLPFLCEDTWDNPKKSHGGFFSNFKLDTNTSSLILSAVSHGGSLPQTVCRWLGLVYLKQASVTWVAHKQTKSLHITT